MVMLTTHLRRAAVSRFSSARQHICDYGKQSKNVVLAFYSLRKCVGYFLSSVTISPRILIFPAWVAVLAFPVVGRCRTQL